MQSLGFWFNVEGTFIRKDGFVFGGFDGKLVCKRRNKFNEKNMVQNNVYTKTSLPGASELKEINRARKRLGLEVLETKKCVCCRCGESFKALGKSLLCPSCRHRIASWTGDPDMFIPPDHGVFGL